MHTDLSTGYGFASRNGDESTHPSLAITICRVKSLSSEETRLQSGADGTL
jgi:hypothetical protein